jgi:Cu+-exporting ATPase
MARDIVCDTAVDEETASEKRLSSQHKGHTYYFCSTKCKEEFDTHPEQYAAQKPVDLYAGAPSVELPPGQQPPMRH